MTVDSVGSISQSEMVDSSQEDFDAALKVAREDAQFNEQLIGNAIAALAPTLLMRLAGDILQEAQSED